MKRNIIRGLVWLLVLVFFAALGFQGFRWWAAHQRQKALFAYFRKDSPVTRRMPADAVFYFNILNVRRVAAGLQDTRLYHVFNHYLDTNLGTDNEKPNALIGGMLEKTFLNVFGEEFGASLAPSGQGGWDLVAVARLTPGSDFLLKLALAQNRKIERMTYGDDTVYILHTRSHLAPEIYLYLDSDYAYATNSLRRIRESASGKGSGPAFLSGLPEETLPETTFLFARGATPPFSATGTAEGKQVKLNLLCRTLLDGPALSETPLKQNVLELNTNLPEIFSQPAIRYAMRSSEGASVSSLLLAFSSEQVAREYAERLRSGSGNPDDSAEAPSGEGMDCAPFQYRKRNGLMCRRQALLLLADGRIDPSQAFPAEGVRSGDKQPLTLLLSFNKRMVADVAALADQENWSRFAESEALYFLSGMSSVNGGVDGNRNEIDLQFE